MARRVVYPLYQLGNPQLRIFRTNFFMTLVKPGKEQPPDTVQFRIPMEMTKCDIKNYLEKIYSVPVGAVRTRIQYCTNKKRNHLNQRVKRPDYKVAYVQLVSAPGLGNCDKVVYCGQVQRFNNRRSSSRKYFRRKTQLLSQAPWRKCRTSSCKMNNRDRRLIPDEEG
ncbi:39S ribosomal protein L23, mitochondrial-like isoform X1 [Polyodon spathula]|uniref:39S ribosomal protein L23, mitochondrial-like isoform X1 n=1 Tax=Polyodon spathula TaxID=7913 RepID=UPI001B7EBB80|nr:39S ribosomal protein L23, mitochondrial-like isoform X1 [Polyodon spathula]